MSVWISIKDDLPDNDVAKLVICFDDISDFEHPYTPEEAQSIGFYNGGHWWSLVVTGGHWWYEAWPETQKEDNIIDNVTHWMPLPEPPEGE